MDTPGIPSPVIVSTSWKLKAKEFGVGNRIDVRIVGTGAVPTHEQRRRLVQIVHDRRMPLVEHAVHGFRGFMGLLMGVAIDIDESVLRPIRRRLARQRSEIGLALQKAVKPFDLFVASVGIGNGIDEDDKILSNTPNHRLLGNRQTIGKLEHGFGGAGLVGVQPGVEVIDDARVGDEAIGRRRVCLAGIGERGRGSFQSVEVCNAVFIGNRDQDDVAAFFGAADGEYPNARRSGRKSAAVRVRLSGVDELARRAGMRPRKARGEGTLADAGRYETQGDVKRGSVVALAISSADPGSAVSGAMAD